MIPARKTGHCPSLPNVMAGTLPAPQHGHRRFDMKRAAKVVAVLLIATFGCTSAIASSFGQQNDHLIIPNERVGSVRLGMSDRDLFKLGVPNETAPYGKWIRYTYDELRVLVDAESHTVGMIRLINDHTYHTSDGIGIGSTLQDVERCLGPPDKIDGNQYHGNAPNDLYYGNMDISFQRVISIQRDAPASAVQSIYIQSPGAGVF